jgi:hypothetical protein
MRPGYYERTAELAGWMAHSRESLIGAGPMRRWNEFSTVPVTLREKTWYLHVLPKYQGPIQLFYVPEPKEVTLLRDGAAVKYTYEGRRVTITLTKEMRTRLNDVVAVVWSEEPPR